MTPPWLILLVLMALFGFDSWYYLVIGERTTLRVALAVVQLVLLAVGLVV